MSRAVVVGAAATTGRDMMSRAFIPPAFSGGFALSSLLLAVIPYLLAPGRPERAPASPAPGGQFGHRHWVQDRDDGCLSLLADRDVAGQQEPDVNIGLKSRVRQRGV